MLDHAPSTVSLAGRLTEGFRFDSASAIWQLNAALPDRDALANSLMSCIA